MVLPARLITADWFPGALAVLNTVITSALIYFLRQRRLDLSLAYSVIILIVTASRAATQMTLFLTLVTTIYGFALYSGNRGYGGGAGTAFSSAFRFCGSGPFFIGEPPRRSTF